jgi:hypothetical protein
MLGRIVSQSGNQLYRLGDSINLYAISLREVNNS